MINIDNLLRTVVADTNIYKSKLLAHLEWEPGSTHLLVASSIIQKRYILIKENEVDIGSLDDSLYFYEVVKELQAPTYEGILNKIEEGDWLGNFSFLLTTRQFDTKQERVLLEKNYAHLIYLTEPPIETIEFLQMDFYLGFNSEKAKWGVCWLKHDSPFSREEGLLCPRQNCITEGLGVIWASKAEADLILKNILLITRKFGSKGNFRNYPTAKDFMDDFLMIMKKIANKSMKASEIEEWSSNALAQFSVT
ncbi:hypothetical protein D0469_07135 [Peribacillus saganii]|uniref:Uncharacterized protein n=1 Tax=Peribacillus saganii TaxID=2303992 RepID=A0A372LQ81_9BACI|nr:hypothetical protein [Peribacillus saganii]RFU70368.1 hypothetical protein D0469_07135 [Peribacillus saganii]